MYEYDSTRVLPKAHNHQSDFILADLEIILEILTY